MTQIHVNCTDQVLTVTSRPLIASGGVNEERVEFTFCSKWDGHTKTAVFYRREDEVYHVLLDDNDSCVIPPEVLASPGKLYIGVFGVRDQVKRTSSLLSYFVEEGAITEATAVSDPTPDIYTQIINRLNDLQTFTVKVSEEAISDRVKIQVDTQDVLEEMGSFLVGSVDSRNNIILSGIQEPGTYSIYYETVDGLTYIGDIGVS